MVNQVGDAASKLDNKSDSAFKMVIPRSMLSCYLLGILRITSPQTKLLIDVWSNPQSPPTKLG